MLRLRRSVARPSALAAGAARRIERSVEAPEIPALFARYAPMGFRSHSAATCFHVTGRGR